MHLKCFTSEFRTGCHGTWFCMVFRVFWIQYFKIFPHSQFVFKRSFRGRLHILTSVKGVVMSRSSCASTVAFVRPISPPPRHSHPFSILPQPLRCLHRAADLSTPPPASHPFSILPQPLRCLRRAADLPSPRFASATSTATKYCVPHSCIRVHLIPNACIPMAPPWPRDTCPINMPPLTLPIPCQVRQIVAYFPKAKVLIWEFFHQFGCPMTTHDHIWDFPVPIFCGLASSTHSVSAGMKCWAEIVWKSWSVRCWVFFFTQVGTVL